ncbi:MAG: TetR family transcriptional regulator [Chlorobi bacterium]|nr:TetR family transcriptional regulator [Chlorobiota bacterium]
MAIRSRAVSDAQKEERRESILHSALELFREESFDAINVARVAERAGIAKGTIYLYFTTKEEMFLALYRKGYTTWIKLMEEELLSGQGRHSIPKIASLFVKTLAGEQDFLRLTAILHTRLIPNIPLEAEHVFKGFMRESLRRLGPLLEENLDFLRSGDGLALLVRTQALIIGLQHLARSAPAISEATREEIPDPLNIDFSRALNQTLTVMLIGLKTARRS